MARPKGTKKYGKAKEPAGGWLKASPYTKHGQKLIDLIQSGEVTSVSRNICRQACFDCSSNIRLSFSRNQGHHGKNTGIIKIVFDFTSHMYHMHRTTPLTPRSHHAQTPLAPRSDHAHTPLTSPFHVKVIARRAVANIHPTIDKLLR
jgi:hypothetical protein